MIRQTVPIITVHSAASWFLRVGKAWSSPSPSRPSQALPSHPALLSSPAMCLKGPPPCLPMGSPSDCSGLSFHVTFSGQLGCHGLPRTPVHFPVSGWLVLLKRILGSHFISPSPLTRDVWARGCGPCSSCSYSISRVQPRI